MNTSDPARPPAVASYEIDGALAALAAVQPRDGLEQRILARLQSAPTLPWYHRFALAPLHRHRWASAAVAAAIVVAGGVTMTAYRHHPAPLATPVALHLPHPAQQPAAAAASIGVSDHPLAENRVKSRHRGVHRSYRATHERVPLPRGTVAPTRVQPLPAPQ